MRLDSAKIESLKAGLLKFEAISRKDLLRLSLERYLFYEMPFLVFSTKPSESKNAHIKLDALKCSELVIRFSEAIKYSEVYASNRWISIDLEKFDEDEFSELISYSIGVVSKSLSHHLRGLLREGKG